MLTDKADAAQEAFFRASAEENMDVLNNLQGRIVGGASHLCGVQYPNDAPV